MGCSERTSGSIGAAALSGGQVSEGVHPASVPIVSKDTLACSKLLFFDRTRVFR